VTVVQVLEYLEQKARFMGSNEDLHQCGKVIMGII
jgi:hypothetical protein